MDENKKDILCVSRSAEASDSQLKVMVEASPDSILTPDDKGFAECIIRPRILLQ